MATQRANLSSRATSTEALEAELSRAGLALVNEAHFLVLNGKDFLKSYSEAASRVRDAYTLWDEKNRLRRVRLGY